MKFHAGIRPLTLDDPFSGEVARSTALSIRFMPHERRDGDVWQWGFDIQLFNALNTPYFGAPNNLSFTSVNSISPDGPRVGEIRSLRTKMRIVQFALKLYF